MLSRVIGSIARFTCCAACLCGPSSAALAQTPSAPAAATQPVPPASTTATSSVVSLPRIAFEETLTAPAQFAALLGPRRSTLPVVVRLLPPAAASLATLDLPAVSARLKTYRDVNVPVWVVLPPAPSTVDGMASWRETLRGVASRLADAAIVEIPVDVSAPDVAALAVKTAAVELRAAIADVRIAIAAAAGRGAPGADAASLTTSTLDALYRTDLAAYVDAVVLTRTKTASARAVAACDLGERSGIRAWLDAHDPTASILETGVDLSGSPSAASDAFLHRELCVLGQPALVTAYRATQAEARAVLARAAPMADLLGGSVVRLDDEAAAVRVEVAGGAARVSHALLYDTATFGTYFIYRGDGAPGPGAGPGGGEGATLQVSLRIATGAPPRVRDPWSGRDRPVLAFSRDAATQRSTIGLPLLDRPLILDFNDALGDTYAERNDVTAQASLSVAEIVARHQQVQAAQDALVRSYIVSARMEQHFRPTVADAGYDVITENRFFVDDTGAEWEELRFSVNGREWTSNRPAFPMLQPEKVLSAPFELRLSDDYKYRLAGRDVIGGRDTYVVRFDPASQERSLYRGTVWIDTETFARVKVQTVQTRLTAPVVSNEETHYYDAVGLVGGRSIVLPSKTLAQQIVLVAGRNLLVEKATVFSAYQLNPEHFGPSRQAARASDRIMYRDTDRGVRYYVKDGAQRVINDRPTTSAKAMAMGVTLDPSYDFPLPIVGINYLDFDFGGPDRQLALLFGGVLAAGNIQRPKLLGTRLDASVDFFGIAVPGSDRVYNDAGERETERVLNWPLSTGANIGYQFTSFQKVSAQYQYRFDAYIKDRTTSEDYETPSTTSTHGVGAAYEYKRGGYAIAASGTWFSRSRWEEWGPAGALMRTPRTYEKYSVNVSKDVFVGPFQKIHLNGAYFGGRRLDRFSQYQFGMFDDTRIHGVPSSGVRFAELAMARGSYTFNLFEQYRFDVFLEHAVGRIRHEGLSWQHLTGLGLAMNVRGPWNTILRIDAGHSFLPDRYRATGSNVVQVLFLKPL